MAEVRTLRGTKSDLHEEDDVLAPAGNGSKAGSIVKLRMLLASVAPI